MLIKSFGNDREVDNARDLLASLEQYYANTSITLQPAQNECSFNGLIFIDVEVNDSGIKLRRSYGNREYVSADSLFTNREQSNV